jgi:hypothetical protein
LHAAVARSAAKQFAEKRRFVSGYRLSDTASRLKSNASLGAERRARHTLTASRERLGGFAMIRTGTWSYDSAEPFASRMAGLRSG